MALASERGRLATSNGHGSGLTQVPAVRLLLRPFRVLPEPMSLLKAAEIAVLSPVPAANVLLLMQAFGAPSAAALAASIWIPVGPGPLIVAPDTLSLGASRINTGTTELVPE